MELIDIGSPPPGKVERIKSLISSPKFRLIGVFIAAALLVYLLFVGLQKVFSRETQTVMLMEVVGLVEVSSGDPAGDWHLASNGQYIKEGKRIRTGADGSVVLLFYEGTRTVLSPGTELTLIHLDGNGNRELVVDLDQRTGETIHSVVPFQNEDSSFQVHTQAGIASVHGTTFRVSVYQEGASRFSVTEGQVLVTAEGQELMLSAGQVTTVVANEPLDDPAYQFSIKGTVTTIDGDIWVVDGVSIQMTVETNLKGDPGVGSFVHVEGHIEEGTWIADMIKVQKENNAKSSFTGVVESIGDPWMISGNPVYVDGGTNIDDGVGVDVSVEVTFTVLEDGSWLALDIRSLAEEEDPIEDPTPTATGTPTPTFTSTPTETLTVTPTATLPVTPTATITVTAVTTDCVGADPQPKGQTLADTYGVPYDEIMGWFCQGFGFGEIDQAYSLSAETGIPVEEIFAMRTSGLGWGQIKDTLQPTKTPKPSKTPKPTKEAKPSKTPKPTKTPKPEKTPKPTKTPKK